MAMWRNKALLTVGACAGVAVALYYTVRQISKFFDDDDELDSGNQTPVSGQSSVMEHSLEGKDTEATSPSLSLKNTEATPPSLGVMDAGATPPSQGVMDAEVTPPSLGVMDAEVSTPSQKVMDAEATPSSQEVTDAEVTPPSLEVMDAEVTPPSLEVMDAEVTPPSLGVMDAEVSPHPTKVKATEVTPPSLSVMTGDVIPTSVDTPSSTDLMDKEVTPTSMELTPSSLVNLPSVLCEVGHDCTELYKHYEVYETIGSGGFGRVRLGIHILTGEKVAIKVLEKKDVNDALWHEIDAMMNLHHQHVCQLYQVIETPDLIYLVMEYCPGGELYDYIAENGGFNEVEARRLFRQIVSALAYIHSQGYAHRDLKPENLLLDEHYNIKLIDFGICANPEGGLDSPLTTFCGSPYYIAPELYQGTPYIGTEADVWSLGVVLFTMLCGYLPFEEKSLNWLSRRIVRGKFNTPDWLSLGSVHLLKQMLQVDPKRRVTIDQLLDHQWVMKGYSSPVEWHSKLWIHHLDQDCIYVMAVLLNCSELSSIQLVSEWEYDNNTATYLLLLAKKQRVTRAAPNTPDVAAQNSTFSPLDNTHIPLRCNSW